MDNDDLDPTADGDMAAILPTRNPLVCCIQQHHNITITHIYNRNFIPRFVTVFCIFPRSLLDLGPGASFLGDLDNNLNFYKASVRAIEEGHTTIKVLDTRFLVCVSYFERSRRRCFLFFFSVFFFCHPHKWCQQAKKRSKKTRENYFIPSSFRLPLILGVD